MQSSLVADMGKMVGSPSVSSGDAWDGRGGVLRGPHLFVSKPIPSPRRTKRSCWCPASEKHPLAKKYLGSWQSHGCDSSPGSRCL